MSPSEATAAGQSDSQKVIMCSHERCCVPTVALKGDLTGERKTSRGQGNWRIKVLKDREGDLAFEPGTKNDKRLFLPVVWLNEDKDD